MQCNQKINKLKTEVKMKKIWKWKLTNIQKRVSIFAM
nr:MAG TPA: hypothetical protein [Microviridae sp.]